jgi:hypothetical protein
VSRSQGAILSNIFRLRKIEHFRAQAHIEGRGFIAPPWYPALVLLYARANAPTNSPAFQLQLAEANDAGQRTRQLARA